MSIKNTRYLRLLLMSLAALAFLISFSFFMALRGIPALVLPTEPALPPTPDPNAPVLCGTEVMGPTDYCTDMLGHTETYDVMKQLQQGAAQTQYNREVQSAQALYDGEVQSVQAQHDGQILFYVISIGLTGIAGVVLLIRGIVMKTQRPLTPSESHLPGEV